jgi:hypothetical protein
MSAASSSWRFAAWVSLAQEDLAQEGVDGDGFVVVEEEVRPAQLGVAEPERPRDGPDDRLLAEPDPVALLLVRRRAFLVDRERFGDPQADPAVAGEPPQLGHLWAVRLGLGAVDDAAGVEGESKHAVWFGHGRPIC